MPERQPNQQSEADLYSGVNFAVYDASDFNPRGSLRPRSKINPPYEISKVPSNLRSIKNILDCVSKTNPQSDLKKSIGRLVDRGPEVDDSKSKNRVEPEKICKSINLNLLRDRFKNKNTVANNKDIFKRGDKIVIVWPNDGSYFLIVDLKRGEQMYLWGETVDDKTIKRYSNEMNRNRKITKKSRDNFQDEIEEPFEQTDGKETDLHIAKDEGEQESYPKETKRFFDKMYGADMDVEDLLINKMEDVVLVTEVVKRRSIRLGRIGVRELLRDLRHGSGATAVLGELEDDIVYASKLDPRVKSISVERIKGIFNILLQAENCYLNAILDFPWNKVGPEPYDTLINVFWFRFDWFTLKTEWENRLKSVNSIRSHYYKKANAERILEWVWQKHGLKFDKMKELRQWEPKITWDSKEVAREMGPTSQFLRRHMMESKIEHFQRRTRPSGLTLLLWKSLKWASASEWGAAKSVYTSDMKFIDPEIWEEKIADPKWTEIGDFQGRIVLAGETKSDVLSHLKSDRSEDLLNASRLAFMAEQDGYELQDKKESFETAVKQLDSLSKQPAAFELVARDFERAIKSFSWSDLISKIENLSEDERLLVLYRLGYSVYSEKPGYIQKASVGYVVNWLFNGVPSRYYAALLRITRKLSDGKIGTTYEIKEEPVPIMVEKENIYDDFVDTELEPTDFKGEANYPENDEIPF